MRNAVFVLGLMAAAPAMAALAFSTLIDGRQVECVAQKNPAAPFTVVFENGSRATVDQCDKVIEGIAPQASVFADKRPGYGNTQGSGAQRQ